MKKTQILLVTLIILVSGTNLQAQTWGSGVVNTWTSDNVGIGATSLPTDSWLQINNYLSGAGGIPEIKLNQFLPDPVSLIPVGTDYPNHMEIWNNNWAGFVTGVGGPGLIGAPVPTWTPVLLDVINPAGWLGILTGTAAPQAPLDVAGNGLIEQNLYVQGGLIDMTVPGDGIVRNINANSSNAGIMLNCGAGGPGMIERANFNSDRPGTFDLTSTGPLTSTSCPTGFAFYYGTGTTWTNLMRIWNDGKVTIGSEIDSWVENTTNTPDGYRLYVSKGILTEKLKVALSTDGTNWSDFVFNQNYNLMPLSRVESYVKTNKHLPDVPSASEVKKDGIDVATMDAKLLQKIEELTLYVIQQQKEIDELKKKVNE